ncbi:hypothetical protein [Proteus mirabilis]|uniref:hypothetical protein n=1 Tax=Proteus mirabilis TaxID=584 RepID=UPI0010719BCB|nr:hypothetical protein [Proteus mirabilis]MCW9739778.1 hypothetical protein [Proteus mirabilis]MDM3637161.1 hypothetical protein [Proteus mirabilis]MDM3818117.1 hypothetical protein [Proteus mirabilis]TFU16695.1 hypothetical protein E4V27_09320 [Proteus mirabilis]HBC8684746.1 hypothetical protein [Proteus mirabilis]
MFGLFRKKEKNTFEEVQQMANDLGFVVTNGGQVLAFMGLKSDYSSSEVLSNLLVIHIAKQITELPLDKLITDNTMHMIDNFVAYINDRYKNRHIKKHIYENDFNAIITMISMDEDGFHLAKKIVEQNKPISYSVLLCAL